MYGGTSPICVVTLVAKEITDFRDLGEVGSIRSPPIKVVTEIGGEIRKLGISKGTFG